MAQGGGGKEIRKISIAVSPTHHFWGYFEFGAAGYVIHIIQKWNDSWEFDTGHLNGITTSHAHR
jgi:hypothetical protein